MGHVYKVERHLDGYLVVMSPKTGRKLYVPYNYNVNCDVVAALPWNDPHRETMSAIVRRMTTALEDEGDTVTLTIAEATLLLAYYPGSTAPL